MENNWLHRKDSLILTAIDVIGELGIQGLSTREIAKRQNISEATLFRHYKSKNDLLIAILDFYVQFDSDITQSMRMRGLTPSDSILYCICALFEYYQSYPAITSIPQIYEVLSVNEANAEKIKQIINHRIEILIELIDQAKNIKEIRPDVDSERLADIIMGYCRQEILKWKLSAYSYPIKETVRATVILILNAFK